MNPNYTEFKFPQIKAHPWAKVFSKRMPADAVDLVRRRDSPGIRSVAGPGSSRQLGNGSGQGMLPGRAGVDAGGLLGQIG